MTNYNILNPISIVLAIFFAGIAGSSFSQEEEKSDEPVLFTFDSGTLISTRTIESPSKRCLEFMIQHRFGTLGNGLEDLLGIYAPANIRLGFNYGISDRLMIGIGSTKNEYLQDVQWKAKLLRQNESGKMPLSVSYYGNVAVSAKDDTITYKDFTQRFSYFHQVIVARKFSEKFSLQAASSFTHFNIVDSAQGVTHDNFALSFAGRYKFSDRSSVILEYDQPLTQRDTEETLPKPNLALGIEIATIGHTFQIFIGSYDAILNQRNVVYNANDFTKFEGLLLGFNITRNWCFR